MLTLAFAQAPQATAAAASPNPIMSMLPIAFIFIIFYFLLIRPQKKQQKEHAQMLEELKKNDEVITSGGIYGTIVSINEGIVTLRIDDDTKIKVQKGAISKMKKAKTEGSN